MFYINPHKPDHGRQRRLYELFFFSSRKKKAKNIYMKKLLEEFNKQENGKMIETIVI